ncbi:hypothetical protein FRC17_004114 [Serendipita sp. 399]|nr:hypothetical protein FRC17_004114 [Serendipita sp. 399]
MWEFAVVLMPLGIGGEYIWNMWYTESSLVRRSRRKRRRVEQTFQIQHQIPKEKEIKALSRYLYTLLASVLLYLLCGLLLRIPHILPTVSVFLFVPTVHSQTLSTIRVPCLPPWARKFINFKPTIPPTTNISPFPVEIWEKIIDYALDVPEYFGTSCDAKDLPEFLSYHRARTRPLPSWDPYNQALRFRCRMRLVSRAWASIVNKSTTPAWYTGLYDFSIFSQSPFAGFHRLDMCDTYDQHEDQFVTGVPSLKLKSSSLSILAVDEEFPSLREELNDLFALLQSSQCTWNTVESFAYTCPALYPALLSRISTAFASLGTLILFNSTLYGDVDLVLPHLHTLELACYDCNLEEWSLPKLRHLSIINFSALRKHHANMTQGAIVPFQFRNLEALILGAETLVIDSVLWSKFPKLRLLGCADLVLVDGPPADHPIRHLYITGMGMDLYSQSPVQFWRLLGLLGGAQKERRTLFIVPPTLLVRQSPHWKEWSRFHVESQREGVKWKPSPPSVDPDYVWSPLVPESTADIGEKLLIEWALELYFAVAIATVYRLFHISPIYGMLPDTVPVIFSCFLYLFLRNFILNPPNQVSDDADLSYP